MSTAVQQYIPEAIRRRISQNAKPKAKITVHSTLTRTQVTASAITNQATGTTNADKEMLLVGPHT